jgi:hypothetical protein
MARQYKIEVDYIGITQNAELYWHDNDTLEFVTLPQTVGAEIISNRSSLISQMMEFMKTQKVQSVEVTKLP